MYSSGNNFQIDCRQASRQLALLGYTKGEKVFLRAFYPTDDARKAEDKGRKGEVDTIEALSLAAEEFHKQGRGVYFVVNGGGQKDQEVRQCRAIFYEHDDLAKELQLSLWRTLGLPEPTFQIDTGGKSIHSYWVFQEPVTVLEWRSLQTDLLEFSNGDKSLKNPSRVMRLAGAWHLSTTKGAHRTMIVAASGVRYSEQHLRAVIPQTSTKAVPLAIAASVPSADSVPLEQCMRVGDRKDLESGAPEGQRNSTGARLARNLLGTAARLQYLGERYSGEPRCLFDWYCSRCNPPIAIKEALLLWRSAEKDNPSATLTDEAIISCIKAWQRKQQIAPTFKMASTNTNEPQVPTEVALRERIVGIISRGVSASAEKLALMELAKQVSIQPKDIEAIASLLRDDVEVEESREERRQEITDLLSVRENSLDLADFLPKQLSEPLKLWCGWLNIPQSVALTAVLTTASTLHPVGTELTIHRAMDFSVPPILFSAIVGESGQKKSPVYRTLIKKPLRILQNEAIETYQRQLTQYERDLAEWEKAPRESAKPQKPGLAIFAFTDATGEGIKAQAQETPDKAMFALIDELAGLFNSTNQYRGGKGSDHQDMLSYYDGLGQTVLRSAGIKVDVERIYVSIFGGIQPDVLKELTKDLKDADGHWARFLFVNQPLAASHLPDDNADVDIKELLAGVYCRIASRPKQEFKLSRSAFKRYQAVYNQLEQMRVSHPQPGMRAVYSKMEGAIGRLALNLHALSTAIVDNRIDEGGDDSEISLETMNQAIALMEFYVGQIKSLHADSRADKGELPALLAKLLNLAQTSKDGKLSATAANQAFRGINNNSHALECFKELEAMNYGVVEKQKKSWVFLPADTFIPTTIVDKIDKIDAIVDSVTTNGQGLQAIVDKIDAFSQATEKINQGGLAPETRKTETITPLPSDKIEKAENVYNVYDKPQTIDGQAIDTSTIPSMIPSILSTIAEIDVLKPLTFTLSPGDRINCYPTLKHSQSGWKVIVKVICVESKEGWFAGCTVEYRSKDKGVVQTRIAGGNYDWILNKV